MASKESQESEEEKMLRLAEQMDQDQEEGGQPTFFDDWLAAHAPEIFDEATVRESKLNGKWAANGLFYSNEGEKPEKFRQYVNDLRRDVLKLIKETPEITTTAIRAILSKDTKHHHIYKYYQRLFMIFTEKEINGYRLKQFNEFCQARRAILDGENEDHVDAFLKARALKYQEKEQNEQNELISGGSGGSGGSEK